MTATTQTLLRIARRTPELRVALLREMARVALTMRDVYLPKEVRGTDPEIPEGTDLAIWKYEANGALYAIAFEGKQNKPLWHYRFRSEPERKHRIDETAAARRRVLQMKQERRDEKKNFQHGFKKGDVLYCSWGYDQTNVDFYEVTDVTGKAIIIREIASKPGPGHSTVVAQPGHFVGPPLRKVPQSGGGRPYVKITSYSSASPWDGHPQHVTPFGMGH